MIAPTITDTSSGLLVQKDKISDSTERQQEGFGRMGSRMSIASMITTDKTPRKERPRTQTLDDSEQPAKKNKKKRKQEDDSSAGEDDTESNGSETNRSADQGEKRRPIKSHQDSDRGTAAHLSNLSSERNSRQTSAGLLEAAQAAERHRSFHRSLLRQTKVVADPFDESDQREADEVESLEVPSSPSAWSNTVSSSVVTQRVEGGEDVPLSTARVGGREYRLTLVSVPVQCTTTGPRVCSPPLIAQLVVVKDVVAADPDSSPFPSSSRWNTRGQNIASDEDLPHLTATVSIRPSRNAESDGPIVRGGIDGTVSVQGQVLKDSHGTPGIFFLFPSLQITHSGTWKFNVTLNGSIEHATPPDTREEILQVSSDTFTLAVPEQSPLAVGAVQIKPRVTRLLHTLRAQGAQI